MTQNLIDLTLSEAQLAAVDNALAELEAQLGGLISMTVQQRRKLKRMGGKTESFCRQTITVLAQNPQVVPPSVSLAGAQQDLTTLDALRPRVHRLRRLAERAMHTETALGSDIKQFALDGYGLLKIAGRNQGLEELRKQIGATFAKSPRGGDATDNAA